MTQEALAGYVSASHPDILLAMLPSSFDVPSVVPGGMNSFACTSQGAIALVASSRPLEEISELEDETLMDYPYVEASSAGITFVSAALSDGDYSQDRRYAQAHCLLDYTKYVFAASARIFAVGMYAGEDACGVFSNASLVDCLKGQTCTEVSTSTSGDRNEILWADSHAWGHMGLVSIDSAVGLSRFPLSFTVIVKR